MTTLTLAELLDRLNYTTGENVQFCSKAAGEPFQAITLANPPSNAPQDRDCWIGPNPVQHVTTGRPNADQVTRLAALWVDLDVKPNGCPDFQTARAIIDDLAGLLGSRPVAVTYSGHGLQPLWAVDPEYGYIEDNDDIGPSMHRSDARAILRRWGRLVAAVAERRGAKVDSLYDLPRLLRCPGTVNHKSSPLPVTCMADTGAPLDIETILDVLIENGIEEYPQDRGDVGAVVAHPSNWEWANTPCPYTTRMTTGWELDNPDARHPWLLSQATRIAAAHRYGCLTETAHNDAVNALANRFLRLLAAAPAREPHPGEISDALGWGITRTAAMHTQSLSAELGGHTHRPTILPPTTHSDDPFGYAPPRKDDNVGSINGALPHLPRNNDGRNTAPVDLPETRTAPAHPQTLGTVDRNGPLNGPVPHLPEALPTDLQPGNGTLDRAAHLQTDPPQQLPDPQSTTPGGPGAGVGGASPQGTGSITYDAAVQQKALELAVLAEARELNERRKTPPVDLGALFNRLDRFLDVEDPPLLYRIDRLLPTGGRVVFTAQFKAGKSTTVGNVLRPLADGGMFLEEFEVTPPEGNICLVDDELDERTVRRWLREQAIEREDRVFVVPLRGQAALFDLLSPTIRSAWAQQLKARGTAFLIFDCLGPVLDALGLDEKNEAGKFLVAFDALLYEAGIGEAIVVHHMGHVGERARGDSKLRGWPDVEWRLVRDLENGVEDPAAPRFFSAFGRDVDVPEGGYDYDHATRRITYVQGSRKEAKKNRATKNALPSVLAFLKDREPLSGNAIETGLFKEEHPRGAVRAALKEGVAAGLILTESGDRGAVLHYLNPSQVDLASSPARSRRGTSPARGELAGRGQSSSPRAPYVVGRGELDEVKINNTRSTARSFQNDDPFAA